MAFLLALLGLLPLSTSAAAHDHRPPRAVLSVDDERQVGTPYSDEWTRADGKYCVAGHGDGIPSWDPVIDVAAGEKEIRVRFGSRHRPMRVVVGLWRFAEPSGGDPATEKPAVELSKVKRNGRTVAYDATFDALVVGDVYLDVFAKWKDIDKCGHQSIALDFHLRGAL